MRYDSASESDCPARGTPAVSASTDLVVRPDTSITRGGGVNAYHRGVAWGAIQHEENSTSIWIIFLVVHIFNFYSS